MENTKQPKISTPVAIIVAGVIVMIGILLTNGGGGAKVAKEKTLSEQVGVSKDKLAECVASTDTTSLGTKIQSSVESAMKAVPNDQRGTPYSVIIGSNGVKAEVRGALSYENIKNLIDQVSAGTVTEQYGGEIAVTEEGDHILGNVDAPIRIIEYSDYECPYCKIIHETFERIVAESNGNVSWVYRHWPIHSGSFEKLVAAECVAKIKGNDAFWEYSKLLFGLLQTEQQPSFSDQL